MGRFRYSYNAIVYKGEELPQSLDRLVRSGYDAIELVGEREWYDVKSVRKQVTDAGMAVSSICALWGPERDLAHPEPAMRETAVEYGHQMADMAAEVGAPIFLTGPAAWSRLAPLATREQEWGWGVEGIRRVGEYAQSVGVGFTIEPWNRFETYMVNRLEQAVEMLKAVDLPNGGVHGDTFHMNIDENMQIDEAYRRAGPYLNHTHMSDSNRGAPGTGHIDYRAILQALDEVDYKGYVCFELLPPTPDPWPVIDSGGAPEFLDPQTKQAITHMKSLEAELWPELA